MRAGVPIYSLHCGYALACAFEPRVPVVVWRTQFARSRGKIMLNCAIFFLVIASFAVLLGVTGTIGALIGIAKVLFFCSSF